MLTNTRLKISIKLQRKKVRKQISTGDHLKRNLDEKQNPDKKKKFKKFEKSFDQKKSLKT